MHGISLIQPGDVIGFSGCNWRSSLIRVGTCGWWCCNGLSHVGIVVAWPEVTRPLICESTSLCELPCAVQQRRIKGVQLHRIRQRIATYRGRVWHYPLCESLSRRDNTRLTGFAAAYLGVEYDRHGAIGARHTLLARWLQRPENLDRLFCSEWVAACLRRIGRLETDNISAWSPNRLSRHLVNNGTCGAPRRIK